jgi:hypothetical protein
VTIGDGGRDGNGNGREKEQYLDQGMQDIVVASNRFDIMVPRAYQTRKSL